MRGAGVAAEENAAFHGLSQVAWVRVSRVVGVWVTVIDGSWVVKAVQWRVGESCMRAQGAEGANGSGVEMVAAGCRGHAMVKLNNGPV